ncbi:hypothetical protein Cgig2_023168 [Carnegiea gigantea]|uniref:Uncharacterized protein n=1 Tax=Carnegiea gigantea TaxID=171969 RepID=A0A9Q1Q9I6_9CARY|nr:hypothetical protein Cgig2_023168 [Carnegiea gigantea]
MNWRIFFFLKEGICPAYWNSNGKSKRRRRIEGSEDGRNTASNKHRIQRHGRCEGVEYSRIEEERERGRSWDWESYRYELWCLARAAGVRYCVLYCDAEEKDSRKWNDDRREKGEAAYNENIFEDLVRRFEKPDSRNRWDSPLFELWPSKDLIDKSSAAILDAVSYLTKKVDSKTRDVKVLQPTIATQSARPSEANSLYEMDRATQEVMNAIVEAQSQALGGPLNGISIGQGLPTINIQRSVGLPELRRLRRTFVKLTGQTSLSGRPPPADAESAKRMFVDYLNRELGA